MPDENYTVKISRREGTVEITGPDKDWIAAQLDRLAVVYEQEPVEREQPGEENGGSGGDEQGDETAQRKPARRRRSTGRSSAPRAAKASQLDAKLTKQVTDTMHAYFAERPKATASHQNRAAVIATFLMDELNEDSIAPNDLIAVYRAMGWPPPKNPSAVIRNATDRNHYFGGMRDGRVSLTPTGEHFGRHGSKQADEKA